MYYIYIVENLLNVELDLSTQFNSTIRNLKMLRIALNLQNYVRYLEDLLRPSVFTLTINHNPKANTIAVLHVLRW